MMRVKMKENDRVNHHDVYIVFHPKNKRDIYLLMKNMNKQLNEIDVFDEYNNHYSISLISIYYIETIEHKVFVYTKDNMYRTRFPIKTLKEKLEKYNFFQINAKTLVNKAHIIHYKVEKNSRRSITLDNSEVLIVNRHYKNEIGIPDKHSNSENSNK